MEFRQERDTMGKVQIPTAAYYGAQTQRAVDNFSISGLTLPLTFIHALALIKRCAARVNHDLDLLPAKIAAAIETAAREVQAGKWDREFVVDVFQTGSGTSTNMNMNEVLASRANEILSGHKGGKSPVHPNDHVNLGQSSNDLIPSTLHIAALQTLRTSLQPGLQQLHAALQKQANDLADVSKIGRTHLQDAVPLTLGQEFSGYARQIELGLARIQSVQERLCELALGGTAVGTGINAHPRFARGVIGLIAAETGLAVVEATNHFEAQGSQDAAVETSGALKTIAGSLFKISNDIRFLASGPRCGLGELTIPALQPGSSIMPGKVNPVIPEAVMQVAAQVMGNDTTIMICGQNGNFELNTMLPVMTYNLLQSIDILGAAARLLADRCVHGLAANRNTCADYMRKSLALVTALVPHIGYDRAAELAKKAHARGQTIRQVTLDEQVLPVDQVDKLLPGSDGPGN